MRLKAFFLLALLAITIVSPARAQNTNAAPGSVVSWGILMLPDVAPGTRFTNIAARANHNLALTSDGAYVAWGDNTYGQSAIPIPLNDLVTIAPGARHNVALKSNGTVVAWGNDTEGQLSRLPSGLNGVIAVAGGNTHSLALKSDGTVVAWGDNAYTQSTVPVGLNGAIAIAAGYNHSLALKSDGTVVSWGVNTFGQSKVPGTLSNVVAIAGGGLHSLALRSDGTVVAWGTNTVPAGLTGVVAIAAGYNHSLTLKSDGTVDGWGTTVPGGLEGVVAIAAGDYHSLALKSDGTIVAWGQNDFYQSALPGEITGMAAIAAGVRHSAGLKTNGTVVGLEGLAPPSGLTGVVAIAAGNYHSLALHADGKVGAWWGRPLDVQDYGQARVPAGLTGVVAISAGGYHSLALKSDGTIVGWGDNGFGQITGHTLSNNVVAIAAGSQFSLALKSDGTVAGWGYNPAGQATAPAGLTGVVAIAAGWSHSLALKSDGTVVTWGAQSPAPLGLNGVVAISAGFSHSLALKSDGSVIAWGDNSAGATTVPGGLSAFGAISAGWHHSLALTTGTNRIQNPPAIVIQPLNQFVPVGSNVTFAVGASGEPPLNYQWRMNGTNINGATSSTYNISNVQSIHAGNYSVRITNAYGSITSSNALLAVLTLPEVLDAPNLVWNSGGTAPWFGQVAVTHDGQEAARSGVITHNQESWVETTFNGPGNLTFWWRVSSETNQDYLEFRQNGSLETRISGIVNWEQRTFPLSSGVQTLRWRYVKDVSVSVGSDAGWLDEIVFTQTGPQTNVIYFDPFNGSAGGPLTGSPQNHGGTGTATWTAPGIGITMTGTNITVTSGSRWGALPFVPVDGNKYKLSMDMNARHTGDDWFAIGFSDTPDPFGSYEAQRLSGWYLIRGLNPGFPLHSFTGYGDQGGAAAGNFSGPHNIAVVLDTTTDNWLFQYFVDGVSQRGPVPFSSITGVNPSINYVTFGSHNAARGTMDNFKLENIFQVTNGAPTIVIPPRDITVVTGATAQFEVAASGPKPMAYQWFKNNQELVNQTASKLIVTNVVLADSGSKFTVKVSNSYGSTTNPAVTLLVQAQITNAAPGKVVSWGSQVFPNVAPGTRFTNIAAKANHYLARTSDGSFVAWGDSHFGQSIIPAALNDVAAIAPGGVHNLALKSDGTVVAWGGNASGQTTVPGGLNGVIAVSAGNNHSLALRSNGTVVGWGQSFPYGQATVPSGLTGVVAVAAGYSHSLALKSDGTVAAWGNNASGQSKVPGVLTGVVAIAAGGTHSLALKADGTVVGWGTSTNAVPAGLNGVIAIEAGYTHGLALKSDGTVVGWGPTAVPVGLEGVVAIAAGDHHSLALKSDGSIVAWGSDFLQSSVPGGMTDLVAFAAGINHSLGIKSNGTVVAWGGFAPPSGLTGVVAVAAGSYHCLAVHSNGTVRAWYGQTPVLNRQINPPAGLTGVVAVSAGDYHSLALKFDGTIVGWGDNGYGQVNDPKLSNSVVAIDAGGNHSLALRSDGTVVGWGNNMQGQALVPAGLSGVVAISAGFNHSLALKSDGTVVAWGQNTSLQSTVPLGLNGVVAISAGAFHNLALKSDGSIVAWGENSNGQSMVPGGLDAFSAISAGGAHNLARMAGTNRTQNISPALIIQPLSQMIPIGSNVTFAVGASGEPPLNYQWRRNGTNINGATSSSYTISNVQSNHAGNYSVSITNAYGSTISSNALLTVISLALPEVLDTPNSVWNSGGTAPWFGQLAMTHDGFDAARSGAITHNQESWVETTFNGPGNLTFWWKVSSETNQDFLEFHQNGALQTRISGTVEWEHRTYQLSSGVQTLRWCYVKDISVSIGSDAAWLDEVVFTQTGPQTNVVYFDPFSASGPLTGSPQSHGGTGSATWTAPNDGITMGGTNLTVTSGSRWGALPFVPVDGNKYRLSMDMNATHTGDDWFAIGFSDTPDPVGSYETQRLSGWYLIRGLNPGFPLHSFAGYGTQGGEVAGNFTGPHNIAVILDTTLDNWTFQYFVDGVSQRGPVPFSSVAGVNPSIHYVTFGSYNTARGIMDNFKLENIFQVEVGPPTIVIPPKDATVVLGGTAHFEVSAAGPKPISYQWFKNNQELLNQTGSKLTVTNLNLADNGSKITVKVSNIHGSTTNSPVTLTVLNVAGPLIHKFSFNDGTANDSVGGMQGVLKGTSMIVGGQLLLDGSEGGFVQLSDYAMPPAGSATVVAWFRASSSIGSSARVFDFGSGMLNHFNFIPMTGGSARLGLKTGADLETSLNSAPALNDNQDHLVAAVIDSAPTATGANGTMVLYVDGNPVGTNDLNGTITLASLDSGPQNYFGKSQGLTDPLFKGLIDEVRVYNTALSPQAIAALVPDANPATFPVIDTQPIDTSVDLGGSASLLVGVAGSKPLTYRWRLNGQNIGAPNTNVLTLTSVTTNDFGSYDVVISNNFGSVTSLVAQVSLQRWSYEAWNDDDTSGVDSNYYYTHAFSLGSSSNTTINGLGFTAVPGGNPSVTNSFVVTGVPNVFNNDPNNIPVGSGSRVLANDFIYGGNPGILTLSGLTPGTDYLLTLYSIGWEDSGRTIQFSAANGQRLTVDQDTYLDNNGIRILYRYTAGSSGSVSVTNSQVGIGTFHIYGFSNRELQLPEPKVTLRTSRGSNGSLIFSWPQTPGGYTLKSTPVLGSAANWQNVPNTPVSNQGFYEVTVTAPTNTQFFRLQK